LSYPGHDHRSDDPARAGAARCPRRPRHGRRDDGARRRPPPLQQADAVARRAAGAGAGPAGPVDDACRASLSRAPAMVRLTRIYTRGGDKGDTSLGDGSRVPKQSLRVEAYGTVDEANAAVGLARLHAAGDPEADAMLARIQNDLFDLGADLCTPENG